MAPTALIASATSATVDATVSKDAMLAKDIADAFLSSSFDPEGKSAGNVRAIDAVDAKYHTA